LLAFNLETVKACLKTVPGSKGNGVSEISGQIIKRNASFHYPNKLSIAWYNFLEGDDVRDGTAWKRIGGQSILESSGDFSLKMEMTNHELENNITMHEKILKRWTEKLTENQTEEFKNMKFAMGFINGEYNTNYGVNFGGDSSFRKDKGPNGEQAYSDMYAVFYRSGSMDMVINALKESKGVDLSCSWWAQLPQGFSCGRGAPEDPNCRSRFDRYVPTDCSNIIVKVADKKCQKYYCKNCEDCYELFGNCNYDERLVHPDLGNKEDCFTHVKFT